MKDLSRIFSAFKQKNTRVRENMTDKNVSVDQKKAALQEKLNNISWVGARAIDALDLLGKASIPGTESAKAAMAMNWLDAIAKDMAAQAKGIEAEIAAVATPKEPVKIEELK